MIINSICPECNVDFDQTLPARGGRRRRFCSITCKNRFHIKAFRERKRKQPELGQNNIEKKCIPLGTKRYRIVKKATADKS